MHCRERRETADRWCQIGRQRDRQTDTVRNERKLCYCTARRLMDRFNMNYDYHITVSEPLVGLEPPCDLATARRYYTVNKSCN